MKDTNLVPPRKRMYISCLSKTKILNNKSFKNKIIMPALLAISSIAISSTSLAAAPVEFTSQDWQVVCDNTRTCRLAGYQAENNSEFPVSVLLIRRAGPNASVDGRVKIGGGKDNASKALMQLGNRHRISLFINGKDLGETKPFSAAAGDAELTESQVTALLDALTKSSKIELVLRNSRWQLSDKGATAVMLKTDEAQGRIGTPSAFVNSSSANKSNNGVLAAEIAPPLSLVIPSPTAISSSNKKFSMKSSQLSALMQSTMEDASTDCPNLSDNSPWRVSRLNSTQLSAQHSCWTGVYNTGMGVWVMNDSQPYKPTLVTTSATDYSNGRISLVHKCRNAGDCLHKIDWIWTGNRFVKSHETTTGLCRMIEKGGAWQMPTYVTKVNTSK